MFCPKCKVLMFPKGENFACQKCGYEHQKTGKSVVVSKQKVKEVPMLEGTKMDVLPKTRVACPKCNHNEAYWILRQTRASDEPETRIFTCTKCGHTWRQY